MSKELQKLQKVALLMLDGYQLVEAIKVAKVILSNNERQFLDNNKELIYAMYLKDIMDMSFEYDCFN